MSKCLLNTDRHETLTISLGSCSSAWLHSHKQGFPDIQSVPPSAQLCLPACHVISYQGAETGFSLSTFLPQGVVECNDVTSQHPFLQSELKCPQPHLIDTTFILFTSFIVLWLFSTTSMSFLWHYDLNIQSRASKYCRKITSFCCLAMLYLMHSTMHFAILAYSCLFLSLLSPAPQASSCWAALQPLIFQSVPVSTITLCQVQNPELSFVELHDIVLCSNICRSLQGLSFF